ncbi:MAG: hypothetical protein NVSMB25_01860 [Thermoleophilaceae bacterium]
MRRLALLLCLVPLAVPTAAFGDDYVGAPLTHGPDSRAAAAGPVVAPVQGGPHGASPAGGQKLTPAVVRRLLPSQWCGQERATDNAVNELANGVYRYHAIYMLPADGRDRFSQYATQLQADAFDASALLERSYNRAIRFDMGTSCGSQYLDISVVRMVQTTADLSALAQTPNGTYDAVTKALDAAGFQTIQASDTAEQAAARDRNYLVWLDGPTASDTCGQATIYDDPSRAQTNLNNYGGKIALVFPNGSDGFCGSNAVRHEIGHNLGALQKVAPHAFDGMHCNDAVEDTMCYGGPKRADGQEGLYFDFGNDDYWDPPHGGPLPWWTVNLNRFLCDDASCNVAPGAVDQAAQARPATAVAKRAGCTRAAGHARRGARGAASLCAAGHVSLKARRGRGGVWKVRMRARGRGRVVLALRCRTHRGGQVQTVLTRLTMLPRNVRTRVHCAGRPTAQLFPRRS